MTSAFVKREIGLRFTLAATSGTFDDSGSNTVDLTGLRTKATLTAVMSVTQNKLDLEVWGLKPDIMNRLTVLQNGQTQGNYNQVQLTVKEGDASTLLFTGFISSGWADYSQPDSSFIVSAYAGLGSVYKSVPPLSYKGTIDAATICQSIAAQLVPPLTVSNNGVAVQLQDVNLPGDPMAQLKRLARAANFQWSMDQQGVLAIWPVGSARSDTQAIDISAATGMEGLPSFNDRGVIFSTLFNPNIRVNGPVNITSVVKPACGTWYPYQVTHDLESWEADGRWFSHVETQKLLNQGGAQ